MKRRLFFDRLIIFTSSIMIGLCAVLMSYFEIVENIEYSFMSFVNMICFSLHVVTFRIFEKMDREECEDEVRKTRNYEG